MTPQKTISVQNAEIRTATVEIKTLTVSGKQVTLAVFRQLQEKSLINHDGTLNGVPWGVVNYHPDKECSSAGQHWHVVWQDGTDLRRSRIGEGYQSFLRSEIAKDFVTALIAEAAEASDTTVEPGSYRAKWLERICSTRYDCELEFTVSGVMVVASLTDVQRTNARAVRYFVCLGERSDILRLSMIEIGKYDKSTDRASALWDSLLEEVAQEKSRQDRQEAVRKSISSLPQLFIAV